MSYETLEGVQRITRQSSMRAANRPPNFAYRIPFLFGATIASGAVGSVNQKTNAAAAFVVNQIVYTLRDASGVRLDTPTVTPEVLIEIATNDGAWQLGACPLEHVGTDGRCATYLLFRDVIAPGSTVTLSITNRHTAAVRPSVTLIGHYLSTGT